MRSEKTLTLNKPRTGWNLDCPACDAIVYRWVPRGDHAPTMRACQRCGAQSTLVVPAISSDLVEGSTTRVVVEHTSATRTIGNTPAPAQRDERDEISPPALLAIGTDRDGMYRADGWIVVRFKGTAFRVRERDRHVSYGAALSRLLATGRLYVTSPAGSGKSTLARQIADDLRYAFTFTSYSEGISKSEIVGAPTLHKGFVSSPFVANFEGSGLYSDSPGGVHLHDEIDGADANISLTLNAATGNDKISLPAREDAPIAYKRPTMLQIGAGNTDMTGATGIYNGRGALDGALRDRFVMLCVHFDYDRDLERAIWSGDSGSKSSADAVEYLDPASVKIPATPEFDGAGMAECFEAIRRNIAEHNIERVLSTRVATHGRALVEFEPNYWTPERLVEAFFFGWTEEEKEKAMLGVTIPRAGRGAAHSTSADPDPASADDDDDDETPAHSAPGCPKCGAPMVRRIARRGRNAGKTFLGCSTFKRTRCQGTRPDPA